MRLKCQLQLPLALGLFVLDVLRETQFGASVSLNCRIRDLIFSRSRVADSLLLRPFSSAFAKQGQKCSACSRAYVPSNLWPKVKEILLQEIPKLKVRFILHAVCFSITSPACCHFFAIIDFVSACVCGQLSKLCRATRDWFATLCILRSRLCELPSNRELICLSSSNQCAVSRGSVHSFLLECSAVRCGVSVFQLPCVATLDYASAHNSRTTRPNPRLPFLPLFCFAHQVGQPEDFETFMCAVIDERRSGAATTAVPVG